MGATPRSTHSAATVVAAREASAVARAALERLIAIPSVSAAGFDPGPLRDSAVATAESLEDAGAREVEVLKSPDAHPAVLAHCRPRPGAPAVLLYAHHDVQPPGEETLWETPPFAPSERNGRLYGRGAADDKAAIAAHIAVIRAFGGAPPASVSVLVEGEEEQMSPHLPALLERVQARVRPDILVLLDGGNPQVDRAGLTTSLRGLVDCVVEVRTLRRAVHSGQYGGLVPDALTALSRLLATLHDDRGRIAVAGIAAHGLSDAGAPELMAAEAQARELAVPGLDVASPQAPLERTTAISVLAIDAPAVARAGNQLVPDARAKLSVRLAPGVDPALVLAALTDHLHRNAPWGAEVKVSPGSIIAPFESAACDGAAMESASASLSEAWGCQPARRGLGASIAAAGMLRVAFPQAALLITGVADPGCAAHGVNESVHLDVYERACIAEALLLRRIGDG